MPRTAEIPAWPLATLTIDVAGVMVKRARHTLDRPGINGWVRPDHEPALTRRPGFAETRDGAY